MLIQDTMKDIEKKLSCRQQELLAIVAKQNEYLATKDIYVRANMAKATALKYLAVLEALGLVYSELRGSTKLWWIVERCPKCDTVMKRIYIFQCPNCNHKKGEDENGKSN